MKEEFQDFYISIKEGRLRFSQKAYIFLFCLLLSIFFWFLSVLSKSYTTELTIPLQYSELSNKFIIQEEPLKELNIQVKSSGFELLGEQFTLNRKEVFLDLNQAKTNRGTFYFLTKDLRSQVLKVLDADIDLLAISPDSILLETQTRAQKKLAVKLQSNLEYANGYGNRGNILLEPSEVTVSGPQKALEALESIQTELLSQVDLKDSLQLSLGFILDEKIKGLVISPERVEVQIPVEKYTEKSLTLSIQIDTAFQDFSIQTFPDEVSAYFLVPLSEYQNLTQGLLKAKVDLKDLDQNPNKLNIYLEGIPSYAKLLRIEPERVEYIIKK